MIFIVRSFVSIVLSTFLLAGCAAQMTPEEQARDKEMAMERAAIDEARLTKRRKAEQPRALKIWAEIKELEAMPMSELSMADKSRYNSLNQDLRSMRFYYISKNLSSDHLSSDELDRLYDAQ